MTQDHMMKTKLIAAAIPFALFFSANAMAVDGANGEVRFIGNVIESACNISADNLNQTVDFGTVGRSLLNGTGVQEVPFQIQLTGCDTDATVEGLTDGKVSTVGIRFQSSALVNSTTNELSNPPAAGYAQGVSVKVFSTDSNKYVSFDGSADATVSKNITQGTMTYGFKGILAKATGASAVTVGKVDTKTQFVVEYL